METQLFFPPTSDSLSVQASKDCESLQPVRFWVIINVCAQHTTPGLEQFLVHPYCLIAVWNVFITPASFSKEDFVDFKWYRKYLEESICIAQKASNILYIYPAQAKNVSGLCAAFYYRKDINMVGKVPIPERLASWEVQI